MPIRLLRFQLNINAVQFQPLYLCTTRWERNEGSEKKNWQSFFSFRNCVIPFTAFALLCVEHLAWEFSVENEHETESSEKNKKYTSVKSMKPNNGANQRKKDRTEAHTLQWFINELLRWACADFNFEIDFNWTRCCVVFFLFFLFL